MILQTPIKGVDRPSFFWRKDGKEEQKRAFTFSFIGLPLKKL
jgi:hypothetical protein